MRLATLGIALLACASVLQAQSSELQPGARVRLEAPGITAARLTGTILSRAGDTLLVGGPNVAPIRVPLTSISSLEVSRGSSRMEGAKRGIAWGLPIGLVFGTIVAISADCNSCLNPPTDTERADFALASTVSGVVWGAGIGALIGRERWERFDVNPRVSFTARDRGMGVAVSLLR
jgi:hypothetical protein